MNLLEENDYLIKVEKCHKGIQVSLPERRLAPYSTKILKKYIINDNKLFSNDPSKPETVHVLKQIDMPDYCIESAIYIELLQHCKLFNYHPKCIKVGDKFGIEHVFSMLPKMNEEIIKKSLLLFSALFDKVSDEQIKDGEILEGYLKLRPYVMELV